MQPSRTSPIREARLKKGLSQTQLGAEVGVTKSAVSAWENEREIPDARRMARLMRALRPHFDVLGYLHHIDPGAEAKGRAN